MDVENYNKAMKSYREAWLNDLQVLTRIKLEPFRTIEIDCSSLADAAYCKKIVDQIEADERVIYYLSLEMPTNGIQDRISKLKKLKKTKFKLPKVNNENATGVLYVGKTNRRFSERINQHLGLRSPATYALHLNKWAPQMGVRVSLHYTTVDIPDCDLRLLEQIEHVLHLELKPILGRAGH